MAWYCRKFINAVPFNIYNETLGVRFAQGYVDIFGIDQPQSASYAVRGWEVDLTDAPVVSAGHPTSSNICKLSDKLIRSGFITPALP